MTTAAVVKERPILFSAPMVRALLAGTKTQTRRTIGPHAVLGDPLHGSRWTAHSRGFRSENRSGILGIPFVSIRRDHGIAVRWYGAPGDRLWVRETCFDNDNGGEWIYRADGEFHEQFEMVEGKPTWTPSIHMPRRACRIVLEITDVRVERLQAISEADALAEGTEVPRSPDGFPLLRLTGKNPPTRYVDIAGAAHPDKVVRAYYASLWDDINGSGAWDANPWVWALTFRRVTP